jgi:hypothetical protein
MITVMSPNEPTNKRLQVYREAMMNLAQMMCAPFWWSVGEPGDRATNILNNGTTCYVDTGTRKLGVTANHVYQTYIRALQKHGAPAIECQFGSSTIIRSNVSSRRATGGISRRLMYPKSS